MSRRRLYETFTAWRALGGPLVLATVVETSGSTYSKAGAQMLIDKAGNYQGLISGGCLEGDLCDQAREVVRDGDARLVEYDMRNAVDDEIWGLGLGCEGAITILLQRLDAEDDYRPLGSMTRLAAEQRSHVYAIVVEAPNDGPRPGSGVIVGGERPEAWGLDDATAGRLASLCETRPAGSRARLAVTPASNGDLRVLVAPVFRPLSLLLLGAGPDAGPVVNIAAEMGWRVTLADHREAYLERWRDGGAHRIVAVEPARLWKSLVATDFDAVVIMSHHLRTDREYLRELADTAIEFVGLLGPPARRERLLQELGSLAVPLGERLYAPVGLDIGARGPEAIALSIVTQIYSLVHREANPADV